MTRSPFRSSARDRLDALDRLDERVHIVSARAKLLLSVQGLLLAALLSWSLLGRLPVTTTGEAVFVSAPDVDAALSLSVNSDHTVAPGAHAVLEARDGSRERLTGAVVELPTSVEFQHQLAEASGCACEKTPMRFGVQLSPVAVRRPAPGTRYRAMVTLREEAPLARALRSLWR